MQLGVEHAPSGFPIQQTLNCFCKQARISFGSRIVGDLFSVAREIASTEFGIRHWRPGSFVRPTPSNVANRRIRTPVHAQRCVEQFETGEVSRD